MPDGQGNSIYFDFGFPVPPDVPDPPTLLWPRGQRPAIIVDAWRVMLADPDGNLVGFGTDWGRNGPLARIVYAGRNSARDL